MFEIFIPTQVHCYKDAEGHEVQNKKEGNDW
jgi:hypothetical protein